MSNHIISFKASAYLFLSLIMHLSVNNLHAADSKEPETRDLIVAGIGLDELLLSEYGEGSGMLPLSVNLKSKEVLKALSSYQLFILDSKQLASEQFTTNSVSPKLVAQPRSSIVLANLDSKTKKKFSLRINSITLTDVSTIPYGPSKPDFFRTRCGKLKIVLDTDPYYPWATLRREQPEENRLHQIRFSLYVRWEVNGKYELFGSIR